jgi:hypothetical protein
MSSVTNLAKNLTDTTRAHAGLVVVRVDNAAMTSRALDEASARVAGRSTSAASNPATGSAS